MKRRVRSGLHPAAIRHVLFAIFLIFGSYAYAAPFTGIYDIVAEPGSVLGSTLSGFIEFSSAPDGTSGFRLGDSFVTDYELSSSLGGGITMGTSSTLLTDDVIYFDSALGTTILMVVPQSQTFAEWVLRDELYGDASLHEYIGMQSDGGLFFSDEALWAVRLDGEFVDQYPGDGYDPGVSPPGWKLVLRDGVTVPEPSSLLLMGISLVGLGFARRRT